MADDDFDARRIWSATFLVEVDGVEIGRFMEITGLQVDVDVEEVKEGGENSFVLKLPGRMRWPNLVLKRGITKGDSLLTWLNKSSGEQFANNGNKLTRTTAAITLLSPENGGTRLRSWTFDGAFPVRWKGPNFATSSSEMAVEELEIAHHGFRVSTP